MAADTRETLPDRRSVSGRRSAGSPGAAPGQLVVAAGAVGVGLLPLGQLGLLRRELGQRPVHFLPDPAERDPEHPLPAGQDRKSTRLNSSHVEISYAVFCLKKKKK